MVIVAFLVVIVCVGVGLYRRRRNKEIEADMVRTSYSRAPVTVPPANGMHSRRESPAVSIMSDGYLDVMDDDTDDDGADGTIDEAPSGPRSPTIGVEFMNPVFKRGSTNCAILPSDKIDKSSAHPAQAAPPPYLEPGKVFDYANNVRSDSDAYNLFLQDPPSPEYAEVRVEAVEAKPWLGDTRGAAPWAPPSANANAYAVAGNVSSAEAATHAKTETEIKAYLGSLYESPQDEDSRPSVIIASPRSSGGSESGLLAQRRLVSKGAVIPPRLSLESINPQGGRGGRDHSPEYHMVESATTPVYDSVDPTIAADYRDKESDAGSHYANNSEPAYFTGGELNPSVVDYRNPNTPAMATPKAFPGTFNMPAGSPGYTGDKVHLNPTYATLESPRAIHVAPATPGYAVVPSPGSPVVAVGTPIELSSTETTTDPNPGSPHRLTLV